MNLSGEAIEQFKIDFKIKNLNSEKIIVVHDDLDIAPGKIKLKFNSGSGGHRGVASIIDTVRSKKFYRVKIGIGKPVDNNVVDYVLGKFSLREKEKIVNSIKRAAYAALLLGFYRDISKVSGVIKIL